MSDEENNLRLWSEGGDVVKAVKMLAQADEVKAKGIQAQGDAEPNLEMKIQHWSFRFVSVRLPAPFQFLEVKYSSFKPHAQGVGHASLSIMRQCHREVSALWWSFTLAIVFSPCSGFVDWFSWINQPA